MAIRCWLISYRDELLHLGKESGLKAFFKMHQQQVLRLAVDDPYIARDMDTWDDYIRLHREVVKAKPLESITSNESSDPVI